MTQRNSFTIRFPPIKSPSAADFDVPKQRDEWGLLAMLVVTMVLGVAALLKVLLAIGGSL